MSFYYVLLENELIKKYLMKFQFGYGFDFEVCVRCQWKRKTGSFSTMLSHCKFVFKVVLPSFNNAEYQDPTKIPGHLQPQFFQLIICFRRNVFKNYVLIPKKAKPVVDTVASFPTIATTNFGNGICDGNNVRVKKVQVKVLPESLL